ncbi:MAG: GAF domain-containing protein [Anaerolineae bacterium]|nr:GAF domain-containing protein [Anaerolineae bacterium]
MSVQSRFELHEGGLTWLRSQRHRVINILLGLVVALGPFGLAASVLRFVREGVSTPTMWVYLVAYVTIIVLFVFRRIGDDLRALGFILVIYAFSFYSFYNGWLVSGGRLFLLTMVSVSSVLVNPRAGFHAALLAFLTYIGFGLAFGLGWLDLRGLPDPTTFSPIFVEGIGFAMVIGLTVVTPWFFQQALAATARANQAAQDARAMADQRAEALETANGLIAARAEAMQAISDIAQEVTAVLSLRDLLVRAVTLISERLGFYHTAVFLLDEAREYAVLRAASSAGGMAMQARGYRVPVDGPSVVSFVVNYGESRIVENAGASAVHFDQPDLPNSQSAIVLPLKARGEIIGALDVQSTTAAAFSPENVIVLQTLTNQIATAIDNARLLAETQQSLETARRAYGDVTRRAWQEMLRQRTDLSRRYDPQGVLPSDDQWRAEMVQAAETGQVVVASGNGTTAATVPVRVRGQVIGVLDAHKPAGTGAWTTEEIALLETLADQLGIALDSARAHEDTQQQAIREQLAREITDKMRRAVDMDTLLQTTVQEMADVLGLSHAFVQLGTLRTPTGGQGAP